MKFLAIDYGKKRVGLAVSDTSATFALAHATLERKSGTSGIKRLLAELTELIKLQEIEAIVIGLPKTAEGGAGEMELQTREFAAALEKTLEAAGMKIALSWWDERFSTASVLKNLRSAGITQKQARNAGGADSIDARAAAIILQDFLDARKLRDDRESTSDGKDNS